MTISEVKEYLQGIRYKTQYLERLKKRRAALHLEVSFGGIDYSADRVQNSPKNKLEEAMIKLSDRIEKLDNQIVRISLEIDERIGNIEALADNKEKTVLYMSYVEYKPLQEIGEQLDYSYNYVCNIHGDALTHLQKILTECE